MNHKPDAPEPFDELHLSPAGQDRADQILALAIREATRQRGRRGRRYRYARRSAALTLLAAAGLTLWTSTHFRTSPPPTVVVSPPCPAPPSPPATPTGDAPILTHIYTDPQILARLRLTPQPPQWQTITDDQLLTTLASAGHPAAIIPLNGKPTLLLAASDKP